MTQQANTITSQIEAIVAEFANFASAISKNKKADPKASAAIQPAINHIQPTLEIAVRESAALIEEEQQTRDAVNLEQGLSADAKAEKIEQIDKDFTARRGELAKKIHNNIMAIKLAFMILAKSSGAKALNPEIDQAFQQLDNEIDGIIYPTAPLLKNKAKKLDLTIKQEGNVTRLIKPARFFGGEERCKITKNADNSIDIQFGKNATTEEINAAVDELARAHPDKKITLTCDQENPNLDALAQGLMQKGFKPQDIKLNLTGKHTKTLHTNYAAHKNITDLSAETQKAEQKTENLLVPEKQN